jgi:phosphonate transport system ATP-binding protein
MIVLNKVTKRYDNGTLGLDGVSLTVGEGEFVAIVGPSGAGKSTLLRSINRLNDITSGDILIDGTSITKARRREVRAMRCSIGMIFQQFNLVGNATVQKNVISGRLGRYSTLQTLLGLFPRADYELVDQALATVGLSDKLQERSDRLSGGQQQRVAIARTRVQEARILLADEPVASLDPVTSQTILDDLRGINRDAGTTVLLSIYSVDFAKQYASRIIGMRAGRIVFDGAPQELTDDMFRRIYTADGASGAAVSAAAEARAESIADDKAESRQQ